jgi:hypothetical protein
MTPITHKRTITVDLRKTMDLILKQQSSKNRVGFLGLRTIVFSGRKSTVF